MRVVTPVSGSDAAMHYSFRARIETRRKKKKLFSGEVIQYRYAGECMYGEAWSDLNGTGPMPVGKWRSSRSAAVDDGNAWLDTKGNHTRYEADGYAD